MTGGLRRWPTGEVTVQDLIDTTRLERVPGNPAYTVELVDRCERKLASGRLLLNDDAESAYLLAYDAARFLLTALLAAQGLRPKGGPEGGHITVQSAVEAQFPQRFTFFRRMRQVRNELEYPPLTQAAATVERATAADRLAQVEDAVAGVRALVEQLPLFT